MYLFHFNPRLGVTIYYIRTMFKNIKTVIEVHHTSNIKRMMAGNESANRNKANIR